MANNNTCLIHKIIRVDTPTFAEPKKFVWRCAVPTCKFTMTQPALIIGRVSLCNEPGCSQHSEIITKTDVTLRTKKFMCLKHRVERRERYLKRMLMEKGEVREL